MMDGIEAHLDALYGAAETARRAGRSAAVAELLAPYLRHRPGHGWAWYLYGDALRSIGLWLEAERALVRAVDLLDPPHWPAIRLGSLCARVGQSHEADRWFERALQTPYGREHGWVWILRGANLARLNQLEAALDCHAHALTLGDVDHDEAHLNVGLIRRAQGRYSEAAAAFGAALAVTPDYAAAADALASVDEIFEAVRMAAMTPSPPADFGA